MNSKWKNNLPKSNGKIASTINSYLNNKVEQKLLSHLHVLTNLSFINLSFMQLKQILKPKLRSTIILVFRANDYSFYKRCIVHWRKTAVSRIVIIACIYNCPVHRSPYWPWSVSPTPTLHRVRSGLAITCPVPDLLSLHSVTLTSSRSNTRDQAKPSWWPSVCAMEAI